MHDLTDKQRRIKALLEQGKSAREIAEITGTSRNAVYQQIQRGRRQGWLPKDFTASGLPPREQPPTDRQVVSGGSADEVRYLLGELDRISRRLSAIV